MRTGAGGFGRGVGGLTNKTKLVCSCGGSNWGWHINRLVGYWWWFLDRPSIDTFLEGSNQSSGRNFTGCYHRKFSFGARVAL